MTLILWRQMQFLPFLGTSSRDSVIMNCHRAGSEWEMFAQSIEENFDHIGLSLDTI